MRDMYSKAKRTMEKVGSIAKGGKNIGGAIGKKMKKVGSIAQGAKNIGKAMGKKIKMGTKAGRAKVASLKKQKAALK